MFLLHYPEVQRKVQLEIDEVVGPNRRVTLQDKASLPYTNAVLTESLRMATIVPYALPHSATNDITLNGYKIPKVNIFLHNSKSFSNLTLLLFFREVFFMPTFYMFTMIQIIGKIQRNLIPTGFLMKKLTLTFPMKELFHFLWVRDIVLDKVWLKRNFSYFLLD